MATLKNVARIMDELFPPENVCMEDSVGLNVGSFDAQSELALVCLDCTSAVVEEAKALGAKIIISHHPLIFRGIDFVTDCTPTGKIVLKCAQSGISVFSAHTNMDCSAGGINEFVAELMELNDVKPLVKVNENAALGAVGDLSEPKTVKELKRTVSEIFHDKYVKPYGIDKKISRVAVINGAGGDVEFIDAAIAAGADCLVTGEIKHHVALYAVEKGFALVEVSHYRTERVYIPKLCEILNEKAKQNNIEIQFIASESERDPAL